MWRGRNSWLTGALLYVVVAAGYVVGYKLSQNWFSAADQGASFFPPAGLTLAALVLTRRRFWPFVLAAAATAEIALDTSGGTDVAASLGYALANTLEPLVGATLVLSAVAVVDLRRTRDLAAFLVGPVVVAPIVGGTIAATTFVFVDGHSGWSRFAFEWWSGDGLGVIVVGGAILALRPWPRLPLPRVIEGVALGVTAVVATELVFQYGWFAFIYLPIAILVVLAFRVGTVGVALASAAAAFTAAGATAEADDFWATVDVTPANRILYLQLALGVIIAAVLSLAAEISERERIAAELALSESERSAALELAQLTESEQRARIHAESLGRSAALLAASATESDVAEAAVAVMTDWGSYQSTFYTVRGDSLQLLASDGASPEVRDRYDELPLVLSSPSTEAALLGRPVVIQDGETFDASYAGFASYRSEHPWQTIAAFPVMVTGIVRAVLTARMVEPGWVTADRFELLSSLADQTAVALERASLLRLERDARARAELLESHATRLAGAMTPEDVARTTLEGLEERGVTAGWVRRVVGEELEIVGRIGATADTVPPDRRHLASATPSAEAVRTGSLVDVSSAEELVARFPDVSLDDGTQLQSVVSVPLLSARGNPLGVLSFISSTPGWLDDSLRQLVLGLAEQCGLALERAELQAHADAVAEDEMLLADLGEVLERATTTTERAADVVRLLVARRAAAALVHVLDDSGRPQPLAVAPGDGASTPDRKTLERIVSEATIRDEAVTARADAVDVFAVPLRARDRTIGILTLTSADSASPPVTETLTQRIALRVALALDNALLYEQERDVSHSLQMGLLGGNLATAPGTSVATAYLPGTATLEVGGDWYDAFTLPDGRLALIVGDVVGHGLEAAVAMGQLRGAVRALASTGEPREVLEGLDIFVEQVPSAAMATLAYAALDLERGTIAYACAGHPPPLLVPAHGEPRLLWGGRSTPLGSSFIGRRRQAVDEFTPGDTIVLYTDGLVERRADGIAPGLDALLEASEERGDGSPASLVDRILTRLLEDQAHEDDVCLLAVARTAPVLRFSYALAASPAAVVEMRHAFADWLDDVELDPVRRRDAILAVSEAAANAAEHAYGFDHIGITRVECWITDDRLNVSVRDEGTWREPSTQTDRGRGHTIMEALMEDVCVEYRRRGTVVRMSVPLHEEVVQEEVVA